MNKRMRVFVSSAHAEFAAERRAIQDFVKADAAMRDYFEMLLGEDAVPPGQEMEKLRIRELESCDIYVGLLGNRYGALVSREASIIEQEFELARQRQKICLVFVKGDNDRAREPRMQTFIRKVGAQILYRRFKTISELKSALRDGLSPHLEEARNLAKEESAPKFYIYFEWNTARLHESEIQTPAIIFAPSEEKWNDFTLRTRFKYRIVGGELPHDSSEEIHLAFLGNDKRWKSPADEVANLLKRSPNHLLAGSELPQFFTMRFNMQSYREVVRQLGVEQAREVLSAMNDLVAVQQSRRLPAWFAEATASEQFTMAFTRDADSFFAFHNASSILGGLEQETLGGISNRLRLNFKLAAFENNHDLEFNFDAQSYIPKRIAVLIGKNGVGKSQSLSNFAQSLITGQDDERLTDAEGGRPLVHRLLAVSSPGETYTTFPPQRTNCPIIYRRIFLSRRQYGSSESGLGEVLVQLARSRDTIKRKRRWDLFCEVVSAVMPLDQIFVETRAQDFMDRPGWMRRGAPFPLNQMFVSGEEQQLKLWASIDPFADGCRFIDGKILPLSSGQITFLRFAAQTCLHIENGTMLLFDEPETHLHPNLISDFVRLLDRLLVETGSFAILATHSVYFVREVPRSQVTVLREAKPGVVEIAPVRLRTLGADVGAISTFVFEDESYGFNIAELERQLTAKGDQAAQYFEQLEPELPAEALMHLRRVLELGDKNEEA